MREMKELLKTGDWFKGVLPRLFIYIRSAYKNKIPGLMWVTLDPNHKNLTHTTFNS